MKKIKKGKAFLADRFPTRGGLPAICAAHLFWFLFFALVQGRRHIVPTRGQGADKDAAGRGTPTRARGSNGWGSRNIPKGHIRRRAPPWRRPQEVRHPTGLLWVADEAKPSSFLSRLDVFPPPPASPKSLVRHPLTVGSPPQRKKKPVVVDRPPKKLTMSRDARKSADGEKKKEYSRRKASTPSTTTKRRTMMTTPSTRSTTAWPSSTAITTRMATTAMTAATSPCTPAAPRSTRARGRRTTQTRTRKGPSATDAS
ncbi:hypothetical protein TW95_gp0574 [Pandoravirus inopinatum]|uniref:Uncharacterized protein n=1 Tax=Pandoravirus inopinatum TaxID=1605721 RepID=A0A0B5IX52_9VIRU|nr:hypothetical protein TW95_gp0574 [Pandoravirus inopinatum]AJF97308.1 hypothetical protein [Pandoravirus inopinatum]